jgi:hypothetical protein
MYINNGLLRHICFVSAVLLLLVMQVTAANADPTGCIVNSHTVGWDNTEGEYDAPCTESDSNDYPCHWVPFTECNNNGDCEVLICYNTDGYYACDEEYLQFTPPGTPTVQCSASTILTTTCYALSGTAEAFYCEMNEHCHLWCWVNIQDALDDLAEDFENSTQQNPHITKERVEECNC